MKPRAHPDPRRGSLALVAMAFSAVIAITLAGYVGLSYQSYQHSERMLQRERARRLAETGLEEALWSLNNGDWSNATWTVTGSNISCTLSGLALGEGATGSIAITITNYTSTTAPSIQSVGTVALAAGGQLTRTLNATAKPAPLFCNAIGIANTYNGTVWFNGGATVDSWNSNPSGDNATFVAYSPPGSYTAAANCAAVVAAPNLALNAVVYGYAETFGNNFTSFAGTKVKGPTTAAAINIDQSRVSKSAFVPLFPVAVPSSYTVTGTLDGSSQTIGTANGATEYWSSPSDLVLNGTTLTVQGPTVIIVHGNFQMYGGGRIQVNATGNARVEIFSSGDVSIGITPHGSSVWLNNLSNQPRNLVIYSTSTNTSRLFNYYTSHNFCGLMYSAANAQIVFDTGVTTDFTGAICSNYDVLVSGITTLDLHYDTYLRNIAKGWFKGITTPFMLVQVTES